MSATPSANATATARLQLPLIAPLQAQKQYSYNAAIAALDQLVQPTVLSRTQGTPPADPAEGDTYIVGASATGDWAGHENAFACLLDGHWSFRSPAQGWLAYVEDDAELVLFEDGDWTPFLPPLDDYEEGTWTPALNFGGAAVGMSYAATPAGRYTKIGRTVFASGSLQLSAKGSSTGAMTIAGLPYASRNDGVSGAASIGFASGFSVMSGAVIGTIAPNASRIALYQSASGSAAALTASNASNSLQMVFSVAYDT